MKTLQILEELRNLIPPLKPEELDQLHRELDAEGKAIDPLIVWRKKNILVDGHNRYDYCIKNNLPFTIRETTFSSMDAAKNYIILHQLGRRNLSPKQASLLRGKLYQARKKEHGRPKKCPQNEDISRTCEIIAKENDVSRATVERDAEFATAVEVLGVEKEVINGSDKRSKQEIVMAAKEKQGKPSKPKRIKEPYEAVLRAFKRLDDEQKEKAISEISKIWDI